MKLNTVYVVYFLEYMLTITYVIASFFFVKSIIEEYLEGSTYFSKSKQNITKDDLPTATVCILSTKRLKYEQDFWVQTITPWNDNFFRYPNTTLISLQEGLNEYHFQGQHKTFLKVLKVTQTRGPHRITCISIRLGLKEGIVWKHHSQHSLLFIILTFSKHVSNDLHKAQVYMTSKKNSYGAVFRRWFDGKAEEIDLTKNGFQSIEVYQITNYEYLKGTCHGETFYECFGTKLTEHKECKDNGVPCTPYSLPNDKTSSDYPICKTNVSRAGCKEIFKKMLRERACMNQKPCSIEEYSQRLGPRWSAMVEGDNEARKKSLGKFLNNQIRNQLLETNLTQYMIWASIKVPKWSRGKYIHGIQKDVFKECWAMTGMSLIGNVGGQLGLCLGFSFMGFSAWVLALMPKLKTFITKLFEKNNNP